MSGVRSYTTTNTSETEVIQTGLQCFTFYYIRVAVTGVLSLGTLTSQVELLIVGGEVTACSSWNYESDDYYSNLNVPFCRYTNPSQSKS